MKSNLWNGRKIFTKHTSDKGLISKKYMGRIQVNGKKKKKKTKRWAKDLNIFPKKTYRGLSILKGCTTSLITREMEIKTTVRYASCLLRWLLPKRQ